MALGYEYQDEFSRRYVAEGVERGKVEGKTQGKAEGVLAVLGARKLKLSGKQRQAILACKGVAQLDRWIARAAVVTQASDLFKVEEEAALGYEYQTSFAKRYVAEGKARGKAEAVLAFLVARQIDLSGADRQTILGCKDVAQLDRWIARAARVRNAIAFFEE